jgi:hypothetical protein
MRKHTKAEEEAAIELAVAALKPLGRDGLREKRTSDPNQVLRLVARDRIEALPDAVLRPRVRDFVVRVLSEPIPGRRTYKHGRDESIRVAIWLVGKRGFSPKRSYSIVAKALARLGLSMDARNVERIGRNRYETDQIK